MKWLIKHTLLMTPSYAAALNKSDPESVRECPDLLQGILTLRRENVHGPLAYLDATETQRAYVCIRCSEEAFSAYSRQLSSIMRGYDERCKEANEAIEALRNT